MKNKRKSYRKHLVKVEGSFIPVKDWMRQNQNHFREIQGVPTTFQIGDVLLRIGFSRKASSDWVLFSK